MTEFQIYLLTRLDYLQKLAIGLAVIGAIILGAWSLWVAMEGEWSDKDVKKPKKIHLILVVLLVFLACLIPTRNEAIVIFAGGKAFRYIESDKNLQKMPLQATEIMSKYLDSKISELDSVAKKK